MSAIVAHLWPSWMSFHHADCCIMSQIHRAPARQLWLSQNKIVFGMETKGAKEQWKCSSSNCIFFPFFFLFFFPLISNPLLSRDNISTVQCVMVMSRGRRVKDKWRQSRVAKFSVSISVAIFLRLTTLFQAVYPTASATLILSDMQASLRHLCYFIKECSQCLHILLSKTGVCANIWHHATFNVKY